MASLSEKVQACARELGFDLVGVTPAEHLPEHEKALQEWLSSGYAGGMGYMARNSSRRANPREILPEAKTVICLAVHYYPGDHPQKEAFAGRVSRYAWGKDYHLILEEKLGKLEEFVRKEVGGSAKIRRYVDYGPVLERAYAARAGLGFIGKNTMLITPDFGSWVFLAELITDIEMETSPSRALGSGQSRECGSCTLCIEACPTQAIVAPYRLDARKCISYLTIEHKEEISEVLRPDLQDWILGCDICQQVCPYNQQVPVTRVQDFRSEGPGPWVDTGKILDMDERSYKEYFEETAFLRPKHTGLQRNARVVQGNFLRAHEETG